jgi:SPP1 family predicted phage head-tail adaptor
MSAGEMTAWVTFYAPTQTTDALRGQSIVYTTVVASVWAKWRGLTTRETLIAQGMETIPAARLEIYYRTDITTKLRAGRDGEGPLYEVASVNDFDGRRRLLDVDLVKVP